MQTESISDSPGLRDSVDPCVSGRPSTEARNALYSSLLLYVFRGCTQNDVRKVVTKHDLDFDFLTWRRALRSNGQLMKNCKVWVFNSFFEGSRLPARFADISAKDRNTLGICLDDKKMLSHLRSLKTYGAQPLDLQALDDVLYESIYAKDVTAYFRSLVKTKLGFLVSSQGSTASDFVDELRIGALYTLLRSYPRYEDLGHMKAICKSQGHNHAINIIHSYTTASRQRLQQNTDGTYSSVMVPIAEFGADQYVSEEGSGDLVTSSYLVTGLDGKSQSAWERSFALSELSNSHKLSERQRLFLSLLLGQPNAEFSAFLGEDNSSALETRQYRAYLRRTCQFLKVPLPKARAFLESLQSVL
jgi:hypothetical protein